MLMHRLKAAVICLLVMSGAILATVPSCGRSATAAAPGCCKNEATCPMHQKHAAFGFDVCRGDGVVASTVTSSYRAVLPTTIEVANAPTRDESFPIATILLPTVSILPGTPPPRLG